MGSSDTQLAIRFSADQIAAIRARADRDKVPAGELVRRALAKAGLIVHPAPPVAQ